MASPEAAPGPSPARQAITSALALRTALVAVRGLTLADVATAWRLVEVERLAETAAAFGILAAAILHRGQRSAVRFADLWASRLFGRPPTGLDPAPFLGLRGTDAPPAAVLAATGSSSVRRSLALGHDEELALDAGLFRAERIVSTEVTRAGLDAVADLAEGAGSPGWRRQLGPGACEVCRSLADGTIEPWSATVAAHPHCSCMPEPVLR